MEKIVIANNSTLENKRIKLEHILPEPEIISEKIKKFVPLETMMEHFPTDLFPAALISISADEALKTLKGQDELEIFFMILLSEEPSEELFEKLSALKESIQEDNYLNLMMFFLLKVKNGKLKEKILSEIKGQRREFDSLTNMILSFYDKNINEISELKDKESLCAAFFEAIKAERAQNYERAFSIMLTVFENSDLHPFIFEILKFYLMQYNGIPAEKVAAFTEKVTESSLPISFATIKFIEFIYYYKNKIHDKLESTVSTLAENTDSVFILNIIAPLLYRFKKWHLVGKFYKLSSKITFGIEKTMYLELLADIYENKLELPDFAAEIYKTIAEENPINCTFALSKAVKIYEDSESWDQLFNLFMWFAQKEPQPQRQAAFYCEAGRIAYKKSNNLEKAAECFEKSLEAYCSFETISLFKELCLEEKNYNKYVNLLIKELQNVSDENEKTRIYGKIADCFLYRLDLPEKAEFYLTEILKTEPKHLPSLSKLSEIYNKTGNWNELTEINFKIIDYSKDLSEIVECYYRNGVVFYEKIGDLVRATECFREILDINPEHFSTLLYLEKIYAKTKDFSGLQFVYSQISESEQTMPSPLNLSYSALNAIIYREKGNCKKSNELFSEISRNYPENLLAKENLRMLTGDADFSNIETECIDYDEYNFEIFIEYMKQNNSFLMTNEILKHEPASFWKSLYFLYLEGIADKDCPDIEKREKFILELLSSNFSIPVLTQNPTKKIALMFLVGEYLNMKFFEGIAIILNHYLKFEPKNKRKLWALFFKGGENPELKDELEELFMTSQDLESNLLIGEILVGICIKNRDFGTALFIRNILFSKLSTDREKSDFIDRTISLLGENISSDQLINLYKNRIKFIESGDSTSFLKTYEKSLTEIGLESLLLPIYQQKWLQDHNLDSGRKVLGIFMKNKNFEAAEPLAKEIFEIEHSFENLDNYLKVLQYLHKDDLRAELMQTELKNSECSFHAALKQKLFELFIEREDIDSAAKVCDNPELPAIEEKICDLITAEKYETVEKMIEKFINDPFERQILKSKIAKQKNDVQLELAELKPILFESINKRDGYPAKRILEVADKDSRFALLLKNILHFIGENHNLQIEQFPNIFAVEKNKIFEFLDFNEKDLLLKDFFSIASYSLSKSKITARPLNSVRHHILSQLVEYIKISCSIENLDALWDDDLEEPYKVIFSQIGYLIFGKKSLETDFEKLKFYTVKDSFLLSFGIASEPDSKTAEILLNKLQLTGKDKVRFIKSMKPSYQNRIIELFKLLENTTISEINSFFMKIKNAAALAAFSLVPNIEEAKKLKIMNLPDFVEKYFSEEE